MLVEKLTGNEHTAKIGKRTREPGYTKEGKTLYDTMNNFSIVAYKQAILKFREDRKKRDGAKSLYFFQSVCLRCIRHDIRTARFIRRGEI